MFFHIPGRKAQITVFIIIGIVLIFSVGIYSYLSSSGIAPADMFQPKSPPVVNYIDACIDRTATSAIKAMGTQGGYISLPRSISLNPTRHMSLVPGVSTSPKVPYWYFEGRSEIPSIRYMEVEVEEYINDNLQFCLNNFEGMRDEFIITEHSNFTADVVFAQRETIVNLNYNIEVHPRGDDKSTTYENFRVKIDVKMMRMHDLATEILEAENRETFYENMTIDLMASFPPEKIPFTGMEFKCGGLKWVLSDVKENVLEAVEMAIPAIRFENTDHPPYEGRDDDYRAVHEAVKEWKENEVYRPLVLPKNIPRDSYEYFQYRFKFTDKEYNDLKVMSSYKKEWGMKLLASPNDNGVMKSSVQDLKSQIMSSLMCLNTYHFTYDLMYPIMISINDPTAFHRTGFVFRYAFPVQIFHNAPDRGLLPTRIIEPTEYDLEFCDFVEPEENTIIVRDIVTNAELSRVDLRYRCIREECSLGRTRSNNRHLQWSGQFPSGCLGALIIANRTGYIETEKQFDGSDPFYIDMYPTQKVVFDIRRHTENAPHIARPLDDDMYAIVQLEHKSPDLSIFGVFEGGKSMFNNSKSFDLIRADTDYDLNIMLLQKVGKNDDRLIGGWIGNWSVSLEEMLDARKVIFHVPQKYPPPSTDADIISVYEIMNNRTLFPAAVPEIIRADEYTEGVAQDASQGVVSS
ncbi:hypothetical protein HQ545_01620 [Candidatus Woesearchaeota archaeon]|nr:hypothetical protein [Candidatus Woesearchaeota archaeon]